MTHIQLPAFASQRLYLSLVKELRPDTLVWTAGGVVFSAADMLRELEQGTDLAKRYARTLLYHALKWFFRDHELKVQAEASLDLSISVGTFFAQHFGRLPPDKTVWRTMSWTLTAGELPELIEQHDEAAFTLLSDLLRITRDMLGRRTRGPKPAPVTNPTV